VNPPETVVMVKDAQVWTDHVPAVSKHPVVVPEEVTPVMVALLGTAVLVCRKDYSG
jgi:hypothetical protein